MSRSLRTRYTFGALAGLSLIGSLAGCAADNSTASTDTGTDDSSTSSESSTPAEDTTGTDSTGTDTIDTDSSASSYTDGSYTAEGEYTSPGGTETISVELTLEGDTVTAVTVTPEATSGNAVRYQNDFADGIAAVVVGQNIDELEVDRVAGSSLTSNGFNAAVDAIKDEAAA